MVIGSEHVEETRNDPVSVANNLRGRVLTTGGIVDRPPYDDSQRAGEQENVVPIVVTNRTIPSSVPSTSDEEPHDLEATTNRGTQNSVLLEQGLFFMAGLGSSIGHIATLSSLVYFKILFGPNSFVDLNLAVYLPLVPVSIAQARWDQFYDRRYETRVTFFVRGVVGFAFVVSGTVGMILSCRDKADDLPHEQARLGWVIFNALQQGTGGAILYGQLNQLASFVGSRFTVQSPNSGSGDRNYGTDDGTEDPSCIIEDALPRKFKAAVSSGVQASAMVVLAASFGSGFGTMNGDRFGAFLSTIVVMEVLCFVFSSWLLVARPRVVMSMIRRDSSLRLSAMVAGGETTWDEPQVQSLLRHEAPLANQSFIRPMVQDEEPVENGVQEQLLQPLMGSPPSTLAVGRTPSLLRSDSAPSSSCELDIAVLWRYSQSCCWALALTLVPSFMVGSWFTRVQTEWMELAQILFYVRIAIDLVGRLATIVLPVSTISSVLWMASLRWVGVILFFLNANKSLGRGVAFVEHRRDALSISLVAIIAFFSGYLVTSSYQLAPQQLPLDARANNVAKQASLLTVAFSVSALGGLVTSFVLIAIGF